MPGPACLSLPRQSDWLVPRPDRKCANLQPDPGEGRSQEPAFSAFTNRIHHQSRTEVRLEREHSLTKHLLHKINASRLLPVQVPLRGASDLNYQECYRKQRASACSLRQLHHGNQPLVCEPCTDRCPFQALVRREMMMR